MKFTIVLVLAILTRALIAQDVDDARAIISTLTSAEYAGRGYVNDGHLKAAEFIRDEFMRIGLKTFGDSYFQPFNIRVNTFPGDMYLKIDDTELIPGVDYIVDPLSCSTSGTYPVYYARADKLTTVEALGKLMEESTGKFLVIDMREIAALNKEASAKVNEFINLLKYNPKIKSAGTMLMTNQKLPWGIAADQSDKPAVTVNRDVEIKKKSMVDIQINADYRRLTTNNVIGYIEGRQHPDSFLVVTAHYDHLGKMGATAYFPGANDNASGVAMLLCLAEYFKNNPPGYSIAFIAFGAEESGLLGSRHYTDNPAFDLSKISFLVNFDLAGNGEKGIQVVNGSLYKDKFDRLVEINTGSNLMDTVKIRGAACNSDHCAFHEKGVPCFYIYTLGGSTAYHDVYDNAGSLPLTDFQDYFKLMILFFEYLQH